MGVRNHIRARLWRSGQATLSMPEVVYAMKLPAGTPLATVIDQAHREVGQLARELHADVSWNAQKRLYVFTTACS